MSTTLACAARFVARLYSLEDNRDFVLRSLNRERTVSMDGILEILEVPNAAAVRIPSQETSALAGARLVEYPPHSAPSRIVAAGSALAAGVSTGVAAAGSVAAAATAAAVGMFRT